MVNPRGGPVPKSAFLPKSPPSKIGCDTQNQFWDEATACGVCAKLFTRRFRRHHCHQCGRSVCANCSAKQSNIRRCVNYCRAVGLSLGFKLAELSDRSRVFLSNVSGFLQSKQAVDATAEKVLPRKWMEQHPSFIDKDNMMQRNVGGLDELLGVAALAKPKFDFILQTMVQACGLNPEEEIKIDSQPLMLDAQTRFKMLTLAPLKSRERCLEKLHKEYGGDCARLVDVVRCSIVVYTEEQLEIVAQHLLPLLTSRSPPGYVVVRLKNRFKHPLFNGYRDALYSIVVECDNGARHVCEVQLHLAAIVAHKATSHKYYEYFRSYFSGSGVEEKRMDALVKVSGSTLSPDRMLASVLGGCDVVQLRLVGDLLDQMGEVQVAVLIRKKLLQLESSFEAKVMCGESLRLSGQFLEAEKLFQEVLTGRRQQLGNSHPDTLASIHSLASLFKAQGKLPESAVLYQEALTGRRQHLGNSHPDTLRSINNLALLLQDQGKLPEAEVLFQEALTGRRQQLGSSHPDTLASINNLASLFQDQGKLPEAEVLYQEALTGKRQQLGSSHPSTLASINNLALLFQDQGKLPEAEVLFQEALTGSRQQLGNSHPDTLASINNLASLLQDQGKLPEAEVLYQEALTGKRQQLGNSHPDTLGSINNLASLFQAQGKLPEAEVLYQEALAGYRQQLGNSHPSTLASIHSLALLFQDQGKLPEAEVLFQEALTGSRQQLGSSHPDTLASINNLASQDQGKLPEADSAEAATASHPSILTSITNLVLPQL